ncbi:MAG: hypothetical protein ACYDBB_27150 [Armatimonadota bacterium]
MAGIDQTGKPSRTAGGLVGWLLAHVRRQDGMVVVTLGEDTSAPGVITLDNSRVPQQTPAALRHLVDVGLERWFARRQP